MKSGKSRLICPRCRKQARTRWKVRDSFSGENRPPAWFRYTMCCNARVGMAHSGYSPPRERAKVIPQIGL